MNRIDVSGAVSGIKAWKNVIDLYKAGDINTEDVLTYFGTNNCFEATKEEVEIWEQRLKNTPPEERYIHVYAGIENNLFCMYLIDSASDKTGDFNDTILKKELFTSSLNQLANQGNYVELKVVSHQIPVNEAKERILKWENEKETWLKQKQNGTIFRLIDISFNDYEALQLNQGQVCKNFLALKEITGKDLEIEIIVINDDLNGRIIAEDFSIPRPPFTNITQVANYQLLLLSNI